MTTTVLPVLCFHASGRKLEKRNCPHFRPEAWKFNFCNSVSEFGTYSSCAVSTQFMSSNNHSRYEAESFFLPSARAATLIRSQKKLSPMVFACFMPFMQYLLSLVFYFDHKFCVVWLSQGAGQLCKISLLQGTGTKIISQISHLKKQHFTEGQIKI